MFQALFQVDGVVKERRKLTSQKNKDYSWGKRISESQVKRAAKASAA